MQHVYFVVVLIIRPHAAGYQLLMGRRSDEKYMGGTWQLISGRLEANEVAWHGALREMNEETGLKPRKFYQLSTLTNFYRPDNDSLNTAPMFCAIVGENEDAKLNSEHTSLEWVQFDEVESRLMWPSDREAFAEVRSVILKNGLAKPHMRIPL